MSQDKSHHSTDLNIDRLFAMQRKLDADIIDKHGLQDKSLVAERTMALYVEVAELANEIRFFKFWSTKPAAPRSVILEEYVDGLHFVLSIGLEKGYTDEQTVAQLASKEARTIADKAGTNDRLEDETMQVLDAFHTLMQFIARFFAEQSVDHYVQLFTEFIGLGELLGFTVADIQDAYVRKNMVNFERQESGY